MQQEHGKGTNGLKERRTGVQAIAQDRCQQAGTGAKSPDGEHDGEQAMVANAIDADGALEKGRDGKSKENAKELPVRSAA